MTIEEKLKALWELQRLDSELYAIQTLKGELPAEVNDLEDELAGLQTRLQKAEKDLKDVDKTAADFRLRIKEAEALIGRYQQQQENVKNNREFEALTKEIELQQLDITLFNKRIKETKLTAETKQGTIDSIKKQIEAKTSELNTKKKELEDIIEKTEKDEKDLTKKVEKASTFVEERLLHGYNRIRNSYKNRLGVACIDRSACGGCFNILPPQRQLEIRLRKKIHTCEHCGRVLVDEEIAGRVATYEQTAGGRGATDEG
jgi:uncharacterized protein